MRRLSRFIALALVCRIAPAAAGNQPHWRSDADDAAPAGEVAVQVDVPVFASSAVARQAVAEFQAGRHGVAAQMLEKARADLEPRLQPYVDYLVARSDVARGRFAEAEAGFAKVEASLPLLAEHARSQRARILVRTKREAEADPIILSLSTNDPAFPDLAFGLVRRWMAAGRAAEVGPVLDRLESGVDDSWEKARVARLRADARLAVDGDRKAWLGRLADLWRTWPRSNAARESEGPLLAAFADPKGDAPLGIEEVLDAAVDRARSGGAETYASAIGRRLGGQARGLDVLLRTERTFPKNLGGLLKDLDKALAATPMPAIEERMLDLKARVLRRLDRGSEALALYKRLGTDARVPAHGADALLEGGALARRMYDVSGARWFFQEYLAHYADTHGDAGRRPLALWNLGWIAWRQGEFEEADHFFGRLIDEHPTALDDSRRTYYERALYWRARCQQKLGRMSAARATWRFLVERFPLSYYANLAQGWMWRTGEGDAPMPERTAVVAPGESQPLPDLDRIETEAGAAAALYRLGLEDDARAMLRHLFDLRRLGPRGSMLLSSLYRQGGDDWRAHWIAWSAGPLDAPPEGPHRDRWVASFPRPFDHEVEAEAEEHAVAASLIWAVMRQESAFRAQARSHAKAHGLMQVLHPTAKLVAKKLLGEKKAPSLKQVYSVRGNIHYGTGYLKYLMDKFDGHLACVTAGYNAGPGAVDRWLKRVGKLDADEFVEEIPYDETRGYVRRVLHNLAAYRHLYGDKDAPDPRRMPMILPGNGGDEPVGFLFGD